MSKYKYKYYTAPNKVIAVSTYAGKVVKGVAKCDPRDTFDLEKGAALAKARCDMKIAEKRCKRAQSQYLEAGKIVANAKEHYNRMESYFNDSVDAYQKAYNEVEAVLKNM